MKAKQFQFPMKHGDLFLLPLPSQAIFLEFTTNGEIFAYVTVSNPTIEVVPFHLCGWCMQGVLLAFTRLGHKCQDLLESV